MTKTLFAALIVLIAVLSFVSSSPEASGEDDANDGVAISTINVASKVFVIVEVLDFNFSFFCCGVR